MYLHSPSTWRCIMMSSLSYQLLQKDAEEIISLVHLHLFKTFVKKTNLFNLMNQFIPIIFICFFLLCLG